MSYHPHYLKLTRLCAQLEELFAKVAECGGPESVPQDLADDTATLMNDGLLCYSTPT
jgi:hypothetical protein